MKTLTLSLICALYSSASLAATVSEHQHASDNFSVVSLLALGVIGLVIARRKTV